MFEGLNIIWGLVRPDWRLLKSSTCGCLSRLGGLVAVGLCCLDVVW